MPSNAVTTATDASEAPRKDRTGSLRRSAYVTAVLTLIQYGFGAWVNLFGNLPQKGTGKSTMAAFGWAVSHGPVGLTIHALLGTLLLLAALGLLVQAILARSAASIILAAVGFVAIVGAWVNGAQFVGNGANGASMGMAIAAGVALLCYVSMLFPRR
jgi:hypothetical protein